MTRTYAAKAVLSTATPTVQSSASHASAPIQAKEAPITPEQQLERSRQLGQNFEQAEFSPESLQPVTSGQPLPKSLREKMESAFDTNFSNVRVHEDGNAEMIDAMAYTRGENLYFAPGLFRPHSTEGQKLIGHELTHVMQQRSGRVGVPFSKGLPINTESTLETEADTVGAKAALGESVLLPGINPATSSWAAQDAPMQLQKKLKDTDLDRRFPVRNAIAGGNINQVDLVTYKKPIGTGTSTGYFKADLQKQKEGTDVYGNPSDSYVRHNIGDAALDIGIDDRDPHLANRAVATSKMASLLKNKHGNGPGNVIAETVFASHKRNGQTVEGSVSEAASGRPLKTGVTIRETDQTKINDLSGPHAKQHMYDREGKEKYRQGDATKKLHVTQKQNPNGPDEYEDPTGFYQIDAHDYYHKFDFQNPEIQRGLSDLQIMDAITGQVDRHGANIFIDQTTGKVTGIDNDAAFGKAISDPAKLAPSNIPVIPGKFDPNTMKSSHNKGLPPLVDERTAKMVLALEPKAVEKKLEKLLSPEEIKATVDRLKGVQDHVRTLYATGGIVGADLYAHGGKNPVQHPLQWGQATYTKTMNAGANTSYLAHAVTRYNQEALKGPQYAEGAPPVVNNAPPVVNNALPVVNNALPVANNAPPVINNAPPVINNALPVVNNALPVVNNALPVVNNALPVVNNAPQDGIQPPNNVNAPVQSLTKRQLARKQEAERLEKQKAAMEVENTLFQNLSPQEWEQRQKEFARLTSLKDTSERQKELSKWREAQAKKAKEIQEDKLKKVKQ